MRPLLKELLDGLLERYEYASVLAADVEMKSYSVNRSGIRITENNSFGRRGFTARVYKDGGYAEYSANCLKKEDLSAIFEQLDRSLKEIGERYERFPTPVADETPVSFTKSTDFLTDPRKIGDEEIVKKLAGMREEGLKADGMLVDCTTRFNYQVYHKLFLSRSRDLEQNVMFSDCSVIFIGRKGEALKDGYSAASALGGAEVLERLPDCAKEALEAVRAALIAEPIEPGEYECICTPQVTGMIVHEAFGHGVEMDMFVKDRAQAKNCVGSRVASELVTMKDGAATSYEDVASYFFDDEGNLASDAVIIDKGILVSGICDGV
jgi:TldD protein